MGKVRALALVTLGGALLGGMLGVFLGGILRMGYGVVRDDFSGGLEWALLGGAGMALAGAVYGCALELTSGPEDLPVEQKEPAGRVLRQEGVARQSVPRPGR
jgi:hypothetical protein